MPHCNGRVKVKLYMTMWNYVAGVTEPSEWGFERMTKEIGYVSTVSCKKKKTYYLTMDLK